MSPPFRYLYFKIHIAPDEFKRYYQGTAKYVVTRATNGQRIQFPAGVLQQFITRDGISGEFRITYDENNKLKEIKRIS